LKGLFLILLASFSLASFGVTQQSNSPQSPVEISGEPRHHPKFENEYVRVWDVTVPARDATLWHAHRNDNVVVTVAGAKLHIETLGRDPVDTEWKFGDVRFSKATYIHRAMNVGETSFHNLTIELLKPTAYLKDASTLPKETGREPILENDRVRVYRVTLAPGESTPKHTHPLPGLSISLTDAVVEFTTEGQPKPDRLSLNAASVRWRAGAVTHSAKNVGKAPFEAVDIELK
jgi:quercetin dioxygenase-like cupin family protein